MFWRIGPVMGSLANFGELNINIKRSTHSPTSAERRTQKPVILPYFHKMSAA